MRRMKNASTVSAVSQPRVVDSKTYTPTAEIWDSTHYARKLFEMLGWSLLGVGYIVCGSMVKLHHYRLRVD
jgi:hypothetical protein